MKRLLSIVLLAVGATVPAAAGSASAGPHHGGPGYGRGGYFAFVCGFSHRNQDDPIVFPGLRGRSHDHTYFGNNSTNALSTPASLRAAGTTSCRLRADTAAYWAPTLFVNGRAVVPRGAVVYYVRRTLDPVQPFPAGLKMIAGNSTARAPQETLITSWSCGRRSTGSATIPTWAFGSLRLQVNFPNCWDGSRLDSQDHKAHMAYSTAGVCPASHQVEVPGADPGHPLRDQRWERSRALLRRPVLRARGLRQRMGSGDACGARRPLPQPSSEASVGTSLRSGSRST
jgi:hypothetical protein